MADVICNSVSVGPKNRGHLFDHHRQPRPFFVPLGLDAFEILKHAVDRVAQIGEFVVAGT